jgi:predicted amidohydrolase YtcJ
MKLIEQGGQSSQNGEVVTRSIKLYMDGALGSRGAALLEPYSDADTTGLLMATQEQYRPLHEGALRAGIQINTHAIGDRGNRELLNWYEDVFNSVPKSEWAIKKPRWRDEHTQIVNMEDISRFKSLGVIPSMQPSHAIGDLFFAPDRLGKERLHGAYAWRTLIDSGVIIAGGTDAPVERGDPRIEFYGAVARKSIDGFSNQDWHPEEAVTRTEALKMFTLWPAYASFMENDLGSIEVGKLADFTIFSENIMMIPHDEILKVKTVMTVVGGNVVYRVDGF